MQTLSDSALVLLGHGSTRTPHGRARAGRLAEAVRQRGLFAEVATCFWKEAPTIDRALDLVTAREVYLVPNFAGAGLLTGTLIPQALNLDGRLTERGGRRLHYAEPVGSHPRMVDLLRRRLDQMAAAAGLAPAEVAVLVVAHGSRRPGGSSATADSVVARLGREAGYRAVRAAFLEQAPRVAEWPDLMPEPLLFVAPLMMAEGLHEAVDLPPLFGLAAGQTGPRRVAGRTLWLARSIASDAEIVDIILARVAECAG